MVDCEELWANHCRKGYYSRMTTKNYLKSFNRVVKETLGLLRASKLRLNELFRLATHTPKKQENKLLLCELTMRQERVLRKQKKLLTKIAARVAE
jgi:hypothetical protein